jgi:hypothetical protein
MPNKSHMLFRNPEEGVTKFKQKTRFPGNQKEEENKEKNYLPKKEDFIRSMNEFNNGKINREADRNLLLQVPGKIDLIEITFHDVFDSSVFEKYYRENFGLSASHYAEFNTVGLFAVVSIEKFKYLFEQLQLFIDSIDHLKAEYNPTIKFIKEFTFYSTKKIIKYLKFKPHVVIDLIDNPDLFQEHIQPIEQRLIQYLNDKGIRYYLDLNVNKVELMNASENDIVEIANNFDILQSVNSFSAGYVKPTIYNLPDKSFGFTINNVDEELPIIGIIDTGISSNTPLKDLIVNKDNKLNLTASSFNIDEANHGTAVATLAALGRKPYPNQFGNFDADARLLSIKVLNSNEGFIVESEVVRLIKEAHKDYGVQIFTLTINYTEYKLHNEGISDYAYALDKLAYELNILIFIAMGNNEDLSYFENNKFKVIKYPSHFAYELSNLYPPAESMNNISIGATASNLEDNERLRISPVGSVPAIYTRTFHINWQHDSQTNKNGSINWFRANKKMFKPDICNCGGDFDEELATTNTGLRILSVETGIFFGREVGTSLATPLTANLAAKILKTYPELGKSMQSIKALIINSAHNDELGNALGALKDTLPTAILGHGVPHDNNCLYSSENSVTIILEDSIVAGNIKSYAIKIPTYLLDYERSKALLKVKATLCFKFDPLKHHSLAYCPLHIAFGVFRNKPLEEYAVDHEGKLLKDDKKNNIPLGINNNTTANFKFSESWSQDYYYKAKMLSNTQRINFSISKKVLEEENCILKIAVNARIHKLLNEIDKAELENKEVPFSIVFTIEENTIEQTGRLYDELVAINNLNALNLIEGDLEAEA